MPTYGNMNSFKTVLETKHDIRETFRKWGVTNFTINVGKGFPAVVEFEIDGREQRLSCGRFGFDQDNIRAVWQILEAMRLAAQRGILEELARAAVAMIEAPRKRRPPHEVLGIAPDSDLEWAELAYKMKARTAHPDKGGSNEAMSELNEAIEEFRATAKATA